MLFSEAQQVNQQQPLGVQNGKVVGHKRRALTDINPNTTSSRQLRPKTCAAGKALNNTTRAPLESKVTRSRSVASSGSASSANSASFSASSSGSNITEAAHSVASTLEAEESAHNEIIDISELEKEQAAKSVGADEESAASGKEEMSISTPSPSFAATDKGAGPSERLLSIIASPLPPSSAQFDLDGGERDNQFAVTEYTHEIYHFLRKREVESMVAPDYMSRQDDINHKMRVILTDWLVEVHLKFRLRHETLFLCFQLMDRFLQDNVVVRNRLQLVGVTAMMLAAKYEEIYPPEMRDFVYICDNAYTREQILQMEQLMLEKLKFALSYPTPWSFMNRFCKAAGKSNNKQFCHLVSYITELAQIEYAMLKYSPSLLVASAIAISNLVTKERECWSEMLAHHCKYTLEDLSPCVNDCVGLMVSAHATADHTAPRFKAVYRKFSHSSYCQVTDLDVSHVADTFELLVS